LNSYFITGTDTDIGKTWITAGLARAIKRLNINVGVMKPFAAGSQQPNGFKSVDTEILSKAAQTDDPEPLLNPQFFPISASPYTAFQSLGVKADVSLVLDCFKKLSEKHDTMLVEGMGGIMTPILRDYFVTDLIKDMNLKILIVTRTKIGTINHTLLTVKICNQYGLPIQGIIINNFDSDGYPPNELKRDLEDLTGLKVLGTIPFVKKLDLDLLADTIDKELDLKVLIQ